MKLFPTLVSEKAADYAGRVRVLSPEGAHRIAAGEVLEAPEDSPSGVRKRLRHGRTYRQAVPYLFVDDRPVGGLAEIRALGGSGTLEHLVRGEL